MWRHLYKYSQVACGGSNSTHTFCTQACTLSLSLSSLSKAGRGIRGLHNYGKDLESKGQKGHSWFSENLDGLELQEGHPCWFPLPAEQDGWFLGGCLEAAGKTPCVLPVHVGALATAGNNGFSSLLLSKFLGSASHWQSLIWNPESKDFWKI